MKWYQENLTISGILVIILLFWIFIDTPDYYDTCTCDCNITSMDLPGMESIGTEFTGRGNPEFSCSCKEFLLPRLNPHMLSVTENDACKVCSCYKIAALGCFDGTMNSYSRFVVAGITCVSIQLLLLLIHAFDDLRPHRLNYQTFLESYQGYDSDNSAIPTVEAVKLVEDVRKI
ncbi:hypothetical protein AVEN_235618-1 [Araneus ventricosus]|uniref:Uncharacterized protein n=1 Tax=Araneus ventricosus TaxID=182803 RepID=A0A4Y2BT85_ARAVE|nr:hypothetical protein AVEN_235618-1 [Araneus ventricosus]